MRFFIILALLISLISAFPADNNHRVRRSITKSEHAVKSINNNGECMKIAYDLEINDANPNARAVCTLTKCGQKTGERVPCRSYFPDKSEN